MHRLNKKTREWMQACVVCLTVVLAGCGGGGGGDGAGAGGGGGGGGTLPSITDTQALRATAASMGGGPMSVLVPSTVTVSALNGLISAGYKTVSLDISDACTNTAGRMQLDARDNDASKSFTVGDLITLTFTNCAASSDGVSLVLNGGFDLTVSVGTIATDTVSTLRFTPRNLSASFNGVAAAYNGNVGIEYVFPGGNLNATPRQSYISDLIEIGFAGGQRTDRVSNARWTVVDTTTTTSVSPAHKVTLLENGGAIAVNVNTISPLVFRAADGALLAGQLSMLPPRDNMNALLTSTNAVEIRIDQDGDGLADRFLRIAAPQLLNGWN